MEYPPLPWIPPGLDFNFQPGGSSATKGNDIAVGQNGSLYVAGYCGTNTFSDINIVGFGGSDAFLSQFDAQGNVQWVRNLGGSGTDQATGLAIDPQQNIYVAGNFQGTATFGQTNLIAPSGISDLFLSKWNADGELLWVVNAGSTNSITCQRIAADNNGNVYITGYFQGTVNFDVTSLTSAGSTDIFLAKYSSAGALLWVKQGGGTAADLGFRVAVSSAGESVITGRFQSSTCSFDSLTLTNGGGMDIFLTKYGADGSPQWARRDGGTADDWGNGIALNHTGEIFVTGFYKGTAMFDSIVLTNREGTALWDLFIAKYTPTGDLSWVKREGGTHNDLGNGLACDAEGNLYLVFTFYGETIIGGAMLPNESNFSRIGLAKYSPDGKVVWADSQGSTFGSDGLAIATGENGRAYFTGFWSQGGRAIVAGTGVFGPTLRIEQANSNVIISWPTNFNAFTLETTEVLDNEAWVSVGTAPARIVGDFQVTIPHSGSQRLYRLQGTE